MYWYMLPQGSTFTCDTKNGHEGSFGGDEDVLTFDFGSGCATL